MRRKILISTQVLVFADGLVATLEGARQSTNGSDAYVEVDLSAQCDALTSIVGIYCRHLGLDREKCLAIASRRRSTLELALSYRCVPYVGGLRVEAPPRSFEGSGGSAPGRVLPSPVPYVSADEDIDVVSDAAAQGALDVAERAPAIEAAVRAGDYPYCDPAAARDLEAQLARAAGERTGKTQVFITAYASSAAAAAYDVVREVVVALLKTEEGCRMYEDAACRVATCVEINRRETFVHLHAITGPGPRARVRRGRRRSCGSKCVGRDGGGGGRRCARERRGRRRSCGCCVRVDPRGGRRLGARCGDRRARHVRRGDGLRARLVCRTRRAGAAARARRAAAAPRAAREPRAR
jgi:hypothetical protein